MAAPVYISANTAHGLRFLQALTNTYFPPVDYNRPHRCRRVTMWLLKEAKMWFLILNTSTDCSALTSESSGDSRSRQGPILSRPQFPTPSQDLVGLDLCFSNNLCGNGREKGNSLPLRWNCADPFLSHGGRKDESFWWTWLHLEFFFTYLKTYAQS